METKRKKAYKKYQRKKKRVRKKADEAWQECIKLIHGERCELCPSTFRVAGHHYYRKSSHGHLRYDLDNGVRLCYSCHRRLHDGAMEIVDKIDEIRGEEWKNMLREKARNHPTGSYDTIKWREDNLKRLKKVINQYKGRKSIK